VHPNETTLNRFYTAFAALDADTMASCYAEDASFNDPAFTLNGRHEVGGMWRMLCGATQAKHREDWRLEFKDVQADDHNGQTHWEAHYRFSVSNRLVHNIVEAKFSFTPDGLIASHTDSFDFWRWSRQALGYGGWVLGWAPFFSKQVRAGARENLNRYLQKNP
jgi:hypothetical protein